MLASVLRSGQAIQMSIKIIEVFVQMREMIMMHADLFTKLKDIEQHNTTQDEHITILYEHLKSLLEDKHESEKLAKRKRIGFNK